jgi:hypothetical protein
MSVQDSIYVAALLIAIVFIALFCLYLCVKLFSVLFIKIEAKQNDKSALKNTAAKK